MPKVIVYEPAALSPEEWDQLEEVLATSRYLSVIQILRKAKNAPRTASELFGHDNAWSGDDRINDALNRRGSPFLIVRTNKSKMKEDRRLRPLVLVRRPGAPSAQPQRQEADAL